MLNSLIKRLLLFAAVYTYNITPFAATLAALRLLREKICYCFTLRLASDYQHLSLRHAV